MLIYEQEKLDGLAEIILASKIQKYTSPIRASKKDICKEVLASISDPIDLFPYNSILCSVGGNENQDWFLAEEIYKAKDTPVDKPVNIGHQDLDIIGHMVGSYVVDDEFDPIEDIDPEDLPESFHILVSSVVYLNWRDEDRRKIISDMIDEITGTKESKDGNWAVSLECLAPTFDYGLMDEDAVFTLIARNEETSYLSKHLKCFKGSGMYNGRKIYRVPRDLFFSGKGFTKDPANLKSVILSEKNENVYLNLDDVNNNSGDDNMADELKEIKEILAKLVPLQATAELKEGFDFKAAFDAVVASVAEIKATVDNFIQVKSEDFSKLQVDLGISTTDLTVLKTALESIKAEKETLSAELSVEKAAKASIVRTAQLISAGLEKEAATKLVENTIALTDEQFELVASQLKSAPKIETVTAKTVVADDTEILDNAKPEISEVVNVTASRETNSLANEFKDFWSTGKSK